jgi:hypothetical protein
MNVPLMWLICMDEEFTNLLRQNKTEALVVMAYFCVFLSQLRHYVRALILHWQV